MANEKVVKKNDMVTVYGAKGSKYLETGKAYKVHRFHAETLIKNGQATADKSTGKEDKK